MACVLDFTVAMTRVLPKETYEATDRLLDPFIGDRARTIKVGAELLKLTQQHPLWTAD